MDWSEMFFQSWSGIIRTLIVGTMAYAFLVFSLRLSGNRTLAKLNAFDLVITVAFGSTLASILLSESVALAEGITALVLLIALQWAVATASVRSSWFARAVRSEPTLLARRGEALPGAMRRARVTREELDTVVRTEGWRSLADVDAVVLESDGSFSVVSDGHRQMAPLARERTEG
ncbi:hypothetical protein ATO8_14327 [Roseivivax marinus]|jgi:uncharacterized membrane protein YcaP (DUF421 family)|uniref:YetF C-terminal domain-containing protein n=1 Tax=Roseivivax marinus TaxID=1379903 RepID=W4HIN5_9RHOB|nr:YetF domain-containing protein [Roseivivax marinus]ETW11850.1 hypothetical protein ATO8_14327 [Roseivivax marinus]UMA63928.1 DUF421 domain-containing protein [Roseivivax marinus]